MSINHKRWLRILIVVMWLVSIINGDCHDPPKPLFGTITVVGTHVGDIPEMTCNHGNKMSRTSVITCLQDGSWSHPPVTCTLTVCLAPVVPEHGSIIYTSVHVGAIATQTCDNGYKLSGNTIITCLEDGLWSDPPVACTKIETKKCRISNADCSQNEDCCSGSSVQAHEGTDPRCMPSPMHYPCFSSYQCEHGLSCGNQYSCCSPFWGICTKQDDCCDQENHVCRPEEGYIYKSCLKPKNSCTVHVLELMQLLIIIISTMQILYNLIL